MITAVAIWLVGLFLSAFFSGAETGFYRVTRVRLVLDALGGDRIARGLLWFTNHPSLFVATTLIGNNVANYLNSLAIVLGAQVLFVGRARSVAELLAPLLLAPILFVYGELLPKNLFYHAPNRLLRNVGPFFLVSAILFVPVGILLWGLSKLLEGIAGQSPQRVQLTLARRELQRVIHEGGAAGVLLPSQRLLAQGLFAVAGRPVSEFAVPIERVVAARRTMTKSDVLRLARRQHTPVIPLEDASGKRNVTSYVRVVELALNESDELGPIRPLLDVPATDTHIDAMLRLHRAGQSLARIVNQDGRVVGIVTLKALSAPLYRAGR